MADSTTPQTAATAQTTGSAETKTAQTNVDDLEARIIAAVQVATNPLHAKITRLEKDLSKPKTEAAKPAEDVEGKIKELQAQVAQQERAANDRIAQAEVRDKHSAIRSAIGPHGLGEAKSKILFNHLVAEYGSNIKIENGEVVFEDAIRGTKTSVTDLVAQELTGTKGDFFKTAPGNGADTAGLGKSQRGSGTRALVADMPKAEVDKLQKDNPDQLLQMVREDMGRA